MKNPSLRLLRRLSLTEWLVEVRHAAAEFPRLVHPTLDPAHVVRVYRADVQVALVRKPAAPLLGREVPDLRRAVYAQRGHVQRFVEALRRRVYPASHVGDLVRRVQKSLSRKSDTRQFQFRHVKLIYIYLYIYTTHVCIVSQ